MRYLPASRSLYRVDSLFQAVHPIESAIGYLKYMVEAECMDYTGFLDNEIAFEGLCKPFNIESDIQLPRPYNRTIICEDVEVSI